MPGTRFQEKATSYKTLAEARDEHTSRPFSTPCDMAGFSMPITHFTHSFLRYQPCPDFEDDICGLGKQAERVIQRLIDEGEFEGRLWSNEHRN